MKGNALIILIRNPELGSVKTRLAASIGDKGALQVYNALLDHTRLISSEIKCSRLLFYSNNIDESDEWDNTLFTKYLQQGQTFGERMLNSFKKALRTHKKAVIIGSDCEELTTEIVIDAFDRLSIYDVVIGPAQDGGYYLLGLKKIYSDLFKNKNWSTSSVLKDSIQDFKKLGLSYYLLPELSDIDDYNDLKRSKLFSRLKYNESYP